MRSLPARVQIRGTPQWTNSSQVGNGWLSCLSSLLWVSMTSRPFDPDDEALRCLVEALTKSGQAVSLYDADDNLRYANETYQGIFLQGFEGLFTFTEILRHGARNGTGVRIDDGDVETRIVRTFRDAGACPASPSKQTSSIGAGSGWITPSCRTAGFSRSEPTSRPLWPRAPINSPACPTAATFLDQLDSALAGHDANPSSLCIAVIDIDHFNAINNGNGHDAGDTVLRHFADVCRERVRAEDVVGRMGGEEFLLLPSAGTDDASRIIDRIREGLPPARLIEDGLDLPYTVSAGIAKAVAGDDRSSILRRSDRALYAAKGEGQNGTRIAASSE